MGEGAYALTTVLVLDDDNAILEFVSAALSDAYTVTCFGNGEDGLDACSTGCYDLVITDLFMPFKDGLEFIREVRNSCPTMKIIAITGESEGMARNYLNLAGDLGAHALLRKPLDVAGLRKTVSDVLAGDP